jgi:hypothetical protein
MAKIIELIVVLILLVFSFLAGVKYSDSVKNHASWLFEAKEEIELPDLSNENINEGNIIIDESGDNMADDQMPETQNNDNNNNINNSNSQPQEASKPSDK